MPSLLHWLSRSLAPRPDFYTTRDGPWAVDAGPSELDQRSLRGKRVCLLVVEAASTGPYFGGLLCKRGRAYTILTRPGRVTAANLRKEPATNKTSHWRLDCGPSGGQRYHLTMGKGQSSPPPAGQRASANVHFCAPRWHALLGWLRDNGPFPPRAPRRLRWLTWPRCGFASIASRNGGARNFLPLR
jgi:hypothetical protein